MRQGCDYRAQKAVLATEPRGEQDIRVNRILQATVAAVSEEMLAYLVYHEFLHHLCPAQGLDADFREHEARWPDAGQLDARALGHKPIVLAKVAR